MRLSDESAGMCDSARSMETDIEFLPSDVEVGPDDFTIGGMLTGEIEVLSESPRPGKAAVVSVGDTVLKHMRFDTRFRRENDRFCAEAYLHRNVLAGCSGAVPCYGYLIRKWGGVILLERAAGGDLFDYICSHGRKKLIRIDGENCAVRPVDENVAARIVKNVLLAVKSLHERNVVHRDIKPENILLMSLNDLGSIVLADFGLATVDGGKWWTSVGTRGYIAPEVFDSAGYVFPNRKVDVWGVGAVALTLLFGMLPALESPRYMRPYDAGLSFHAESFLMRTMCALEQRLSIDDALAHPFVAGVVTRVPSLRLSEVLEPEFKTSSSDDSAEDTNGTKRAHTGPKKIAAGIAKILRSVAQKIDGF